MKVYVTVVDMRLGISQYGMIEEQVEKGFEIANALGHYGVGINTVKWVFEMPSVKVGQVDGTTKVVTIIVI